MPDLRPALRPALSQQYDFVFLSIGANDALGLRSRAAFGRDIRTLLTALRAANPEAQLMMGQLV